MKLAQWICQSRQRLLVAALINFALLLAPAIPVASYIRETSASPFGDMMIQTVWLFLALPAGYLSAVLIGDLIFPNKWRERIILGDLEAGDAAMESDDPAAALKAIKNNRSFKMPFYIMTVLIILGCAAAIELVTGGFLAEYKRMGYFRTLMRTDRTASKLDLIGEQTDKRREEHVTTAIELLSGVRGDPTRPGVFMNLKQPPEVRKLAVVTLGQLGHYLVTSIDSWNKKGSAVGHWELELLVWMHKNTAPGLRELFANGDDELKRGAGLALGKMRDSASGKLLTGYLKANRNKIDKVYFGVATSLGFLHDFERMTELLEIAKDVRSDIDAFRYVSWSVGQTSMKYQVYQDEVGPPPKEFDALILFYADVLKTGKTAQRCVAAYVLDFTGHGGIIEHLMEAFDSTGSDAMCTRHELEMDQPAPYVMGEDQEVRRAVLWAFRNVGKGDVSVADWARKRSRDEKLPEQLRKNLISLSNTAQPKPPPQP